MGNTHKPSFRPLQLETPRLVLRHFQPSDLPTLLAYRNDPEVARYQGWSSLTEAEAGAFIEAQWVQPVAVPRAWLQIALELKSTGRHIGNLALNVDGEWQAELGYSLDRAFQGHGYATEAVAALSRFRLHATRAAPYGRAHRRAQRGVHQAFGAARLPA